jgi:malic enzyme
MLAKARLVDDGVFLAAARRLASLVSRERLAVGAIYPDQSELRMVSTRIAEAVVDELSRRDAGRAIREDAIAELVSEAMWYPDYSK